MLGSGAPRPKRLADRGSARDLLLSAPAARAPGGGAVGEAEGAAVVLNPPQLIACGNALTLVLGTREEGKGIGPVCTPDVAAAALEKLVPSILGWGSNRHHQMGMSCRPSESKAYSNPCLKDVQLVYRNEQGHAALKDEENNEADLLEVACGSSHCVVLQKVKLSPGLQRLKATDASADASEKAKGSSGDSMVESYVWSCGLNANGQLGIGTRDGNANSSQVGAPSPVRVDFSSFSRVAPHHRVVVQRVCCGTDHTLAIANLLGPSAEVSVAQGRVFSWGLGSYGALGTRTEGDGLTPQEVWFPGETLDDRSVRIKQVAAGSKHSMALDAEGTVYAWGHGGNGRLGHSKDVVRDAAQLAQPSYSAQLVPKSVQTLQDAGCNIVYIAAGESNSAAVDQLGALYTWGQGTYGRLGHGMTLETSVPTKVESLTGVAISQVALGLMHSVATTLKGQLYAWGKGPATGLDSPPHVIVSTPQQVELREEHRGSPVYQIAAGPLHTVVLLRNGSLFCFGSASEGRIPRRDGKDTVKDQTFPLMVIEGASTGITLAMGDNVEVIEKFNSHNNNPVVLIAGASGVVKRIDELGDAQIEFKNHVTPARQWVSAMNFHKLQVSQKQNESKGEGPSEIFCGGSNSAALMEVQNDRENNLWFWGSDVLARYAEIPSGSRKRRGALEGPRLLKQGFRSSIRMIAIGLEHCLAITQDNMMYTWGSGSDGQLGNGSLKSVAYPQQVTRPTDVRHVAAGERHSACIVQGGDAYTWGAAEGGRLGLGASLSEGLQLMPKQVRIVGADERQSTQGKLLELAACGAQHTALVTKDHRLITFGCGWYGRLGQGSVDNEYKPKYVTGDLVSTQVKGVYCGMYHTCIVDADSVLWVCGRDSSLCRDGLGHQLVPAPFEPFLEEPRRYIQSIAVSEQHTLAVTRFAGEPESPDPPDATELWVWGRNDHGQLGLSAQQAPVVQVPWCLRIPGLERHPGRFDIRRVATGPGHSMCLVQTRTKSGKRGDMVIYTWGCVGDDRLGLDQEALAGCEEGEVGNTQRQVGGETVPTSRHVWTYPPLRLPPWWASQDGDALERARLENDQAEEPSRPESRGWTDVQRKLLQEEPNQKEKLLQELHAKLVKLYNGHFATIEGLWAKPQQGQFAKYDIPGREAKSTLHTEFHMRQKERELETEYIRTLKALKLNMSMNQPKIDSHHIKTNTDVVEKLDKYEELLWVLQQQPAYMANLARLLQGKRIDDRDTALFHRFVRLLYCDLSFADGELRNVSLFKGLLRLLISDEIEGKKAFSWEDLFDPLKSRAAILFTDYITNPVFVEPVAELVLNPEDEDSLVSIVVKYTVDRFVEAISSAKPEQKDDGGRGDTRPQHGLAEQAPRAKHEEAKSLFVGFAGYFSTHPDEYKKMILEFLRSKNHPKALSATTEKEKDEVITAHRPQWRQNFDDDLTRFALLCGVERKSGWKSGDSTGMMNEKGKIAHFIERFIDTVVAGTQETGRRVSGSVGGGGSREAVSASNRKHARMPLVYAWNCLSGSARTLKYKTQADRHDVFELTISREEFQRRFEVSARAEALVIRDRPDNPDYIERWNNSDPRSELRTGDQILGVNGKSRNTEEMRVEIDEQKDGNRALRLTMRREVSQWSEGICLPIASLLLANQLAGILNMLESGTCSLFKLKIKRKVKEQLNTTVKDVLKERASDQTTSRKDFGEAGEDTMSRSKRGLLGDIDFDNHLVDVQKRVFWNLQSLAKLFRRVIHKSVFEVDFHEFAGDGASREENVSRRCGDKLKDVVCRKLLRTFTVGGQQITEDTTEMQLTVELFTTHLSLRRSFVRMPTSDLLELANLLWRYSADDGQDTENVLLDVMEYDRVAQLLRDILPRDSKRQDKTELWSQDGHIWLARQHGECHNFLMSSRFLEFLPKGVPVAFCSRSLAPIPAYLAEADQKRSLSAASALPPGADAEREASERSTRLVRAFHHPLDDRKPYKEHIESYKQLEALIQDLAGDERKSVRYRLRGKSFGELRKSFEEIKKQIETDMSEGRAPRAMQGLVDALAEGVRQVNELDHAGSSSQELLTYIDLAIEKRTDYMRYLRQIERGLEDVKKVRDNYYFSIDLEYKRLREAVSVSRNCDLPLEIQQAVQMQKDSARLDSVQLAFTRCQKYKRNAKRSNPTPAQLSLESLINKNPDGKSLQELREMAQHNLPDQTFRLQELVDRGVVLRIHTDFRSNRQLVKSIRVRIWFDRLTEAHHVEVTAHKMESVMPSQAFVVTRQDVALMEAGRKTAILGCGRHLDGGPLMWLSCFRLRRLLAWQFAEGDLMDPMERG